MSLLTMSEETVRLAADNKRLNQKVELMEKELSALKRAYEEGNRRDPPPPPQPKPKPQPQPPRKASPSRDLDSMEQRLVRTLGNMINARLEGIEERLLPARSLRPPLAADSKKQKAAKATYAGAAAGPPVSAAPQAPATQQRRVPNPPSEPLPSTSQAPAAEWEEVKKRKGRKKRKAPQPATPAAPAPRAAPKSRKLQVPKSAAVVVTLSDEAVQSGMTYEEVLGKAKASINIAELGIEGLRIRATATGARILEIPGASSGPKADALSVKLKEALSASAIVVRPTRRTDLKITGLNETDKVEDVVAAIAAKGCCSPDEVKTGRISFGPSRIGSVLVRCPVQAAKAMMADDGRLFVGWSVARVVSLEPLPMRCYKCMAFGHTRLRCPSEVDYSDTCFRCGQTGHKGVTCTADRLKCAVCTAAKRPAVHLMGGRSCSPPTLKAKATPWTRVASQRAAQQSQEVEMSDPQC